MVYSHATRPYRGGNLFDLNARWFGVSSLLPSPLRCHIWGWIFDQSRNFPEFLMPSVKRWIWLIWFLICYLFSGSHKSVLRRYATKDKMDTCQHLRGVCLILVWHRPVRPHSSSCSPDMSFIKRYGTSWRTVEQLSSYSKSSIQQKWENIPLSLHLIKESPSLSGVYIFRAWFIQLMFSIK